MRSLQPSRDLSRFRRRDGGVRDRDGAVAAQLRHLLLRRDDVLPDHRVLLLGLHGVLVSDATLNLVGVAVLASVFLFTRSFGKWRHAPPRVSLPQAKVVDS